MKPINNFLKNFIGQRKSGSKFRRYCGLVFGVTLICWMGIYFQFMYLPGDQIAEGIKIEGIELGGLTKEQAKKKLEQYAHQTFQEPIRIRFQNRIWFFKSNDHGFSIDMDQTIHNAWLVGRRGLFWQRWIRRMQVKIKGLPMQCRIIEKKPQVDNFLQMLFQEIDQPAIPAKIIGRNNDLPVIVPEIPGHRLQKNQLKKRLMDMVCKKGPRGIHMPVLLEMPRLTQADFTKYHIQLIGTYTTRYDPQKLERKENINLAAQAVNGTVLFPGEIFSYNSIVGLRSSERGYKEAPGIVKGDLLPDIGGGVCQVSTTIYTAALYARLKIVERQNHSRVVPYVPPGQDATVLNHFIDLKIKNNQPNPVIFTCTMDGAKLQVDIWGRQLYPGESLKLESVIDKKIPFPIIKKPDPSLEPGKTKIEKPGADGFVISLFRTITKDHREIKKELISKSYYAAIPEIMNVSPYEGNSNYFF